MNPTTIPSAAVDSTFFIVRSSKSELEFLIDRLKPDPVGQGFAAPTDRASAAAGLHSETKLGLKGHKGEH
jgi:hypothetical protein